ncbi:MAG: hypothetical protein ACR2NL_11375, partial [Acidimicrobiia bacterium]
MGLLDDTPNVLLEQESVSRRRNPLPLLLAIAGLLVLAVTQWPQGSDSAADPELTTTTTARTTSTSEVPAADAGNPAPFSFPEISLVSA